MWIGSIVSWEKIVYATGCRKKTRLVGCLGWAARREIKIKDKLRSWSKERKNVFVKERNKPNYN
jgi:hypothetical protein